MLTGPQKLLSKFQRFSTIEQEDVTESSEQLVDYYNPHVKSQIERQLNLLTNQPLEPLDRQLLKGVYTNNVYELENPPLFKIPSPESVAKAEKKEA